MTSPTIRTSGRKKDGCAWRWAREGGLTPTAPVSAKPRAGQRGRSRSRCWNQPARKDKAKTSAHKIPQPRTAGAPTPSPRTASGRLGVPGSQLPGSHWARSPHIQSRQQAPIWPKSHPKQLFQVRSLTINQRAELPQTIHIQLLTRKPMRSGIIDLRRTGSNQDNGIMKLL